LAGIAKNNKHIEKLFCNTKTELAIIAYQNYFSDKSFIEKLNANYYTTMRLGEYRNDTNELEPILRDSHFLAIDLAAVRHSDGGTESSPNGLYAEELCQIANYAGLSSRLSQMNIVCKTQQNITSDKLVAQTIWHFVDGLTNRIIEKSQNSTFKKFIVNMESSTENIVFYKSNITNRWWMEVSNEKKTKIIASTFADYQHACNNNIPARWIKEIQKMS
jgi:hypothetical protein